MNPVLKNEKLVLCFKLAYGIQRPFSENYWIIYRLPKHDELVFFINPLTGEKNIKRCTGIPGDLLSQDESQIYINNIPYPDSKYSYIFPKNLYNIPDRQYALIGDNQLNSTDTRNFGLIKINDIKGKIILTKNERRGTKTNKT